MCCAREAGRRNGRNCAQLSIWRAICEQFKRVQWMNGSHARARARARVIYINTGAQVAAGYYNGNNNNNSGGGPDDTGQFQFIDGGSW